MSSWPESTLSPEKVSCGPVCVQGHLDWLANSNPHSWAYTKKGRCGISRLWESQGLRERQFGKDGPQGRHKWSKYLLSKTRVYFYALFSMRRQVLTRHVVILMPTLTPRPPPSMARFCEPPSALFISFSSRFAPLLILPSSVPLQVFPLLSCNGQLQQNLLHNYRS